MVTKSLHQHKEENDFSQFYKRLEAFVPELKKFMAGSLKTAEDQGMLDRGFYNPDEMLDEVYMDAFNAFSDKMNPKELKRFLFKKALEKIGEKKEEEVPDEVNTSALLKQELKALSEDFTTDGDGDRILMEELDDISYFQKRGWSLEIRLHDALEKELIQKFELHEESLLSDEKRKVLGVLYNTIPARSKTVIELFTFGDQNPHEISEILEVPERIIASVIFKVKERFKLL